MIVSLRRLFFALLAACLMPGLVSLADDSVSFRKDIAPILLGNCLACHGPKKAEGSYRVDTFERAVGEGDSGSLGFAAKDLEGSEAFRRITSEDKDERMPLEGDALPAEQIAILKRWIEEGAKFDGPDPKAALASIVPPPVHPAAPETYPTTLPITALAFSPDGSQLLAGGYHELTVWNPQDGQLLNRIANVGQRTYALDFSADGKLLAVGSGAPGRLGEVRLLDPATGEVVKVIGTTSDVVFDVAFSPQGDRLASAAADGVLRVFDVASGDEQLTISSHSDWVMAVAWNGDGTKLASASRDKTAKVFDAKTGELLVTYSGHGQPVKGVAFHPDGKDAFSSAADNKIHRWQIADGKKTADVSSYGGEVYKLSTGGEFFFAPAADKTARQFNLKSHAQVRAYSGHQDWVLSTAYHDATQRLATGSFDGEVRIWNTADGASVITFFAAPGYQQPEKK